MSAIVNSVLDRGDPRSAASVNGRYTNFQGATPLNEPNYREEGVGRKAFGPYLRADAIDYEQEITRPGASLAVTGAAFAQLVIGASTFRYTGAPLVLVANELVRVRVRMVLESTVAAGLGWSANTIGLRLAWNDGTTTFNPARFTRQITRSASPIAHHEISVTGWITGAISLAWVEAQYRLSAGTMFPGCATMQTVRFRRVLT